jgi:D-ribose pyranose/furanose isomerase RbsD
MASRYDYNELEREYIQGEMSVRALAMAHEIKSWSSVNDQARKREWNRKRAEFRTKRDNKFIEKAAEQAAVEVVDIAAEIRDQSISILRGMLVLYSQRLTSQDAAQRPIIQTREAIAAMRELMTLTGQPTEITENRTLGLTLNAELPPELAGALLQLARERGRALGPGVGAAQAALAEGIGDE